MASPRWLRAFFPLLLLTSTGCERLAKHRLSGTYYRHQADGSKPSGGVVEELTLTEAKFIINMPLAGPVATDYSVEDDVIYVGGESGQVQFTIVGLGVIRNQGAIGLEGTYIKLDKATR